MIRNEAKMSTAADTRTPSYLNDAPTMSAQDRCDRCGAQAYLRVEVSAGLDLFFCAHHAREHGDKLKEIAITFVDETHKLTP